MTDYVANDGPATRRAGRSTQPKLEAAAASAQEAYESLKDIAAAAVGETREKVVGATTLAMEGVERRYGDLQAWVQLRPGRALGVAAGLGVVLGLLLRGRSTKTIYVRDPR